MDKEELKETLSKAFETLLEDKVNEAANEFAQALYEETGLCIKIDLHLGMSAGHLEIEFLPVKKKENQ